MSGRPGGTGGRGRSPKLACLQRCFCPTGQGIICDDQHNLKLSVTPRTAPQYFPDRAPLVPYSGGHNSRGDGECREKLKRLCSLPSSASPGDRVARTVGSFFSENPSIKSGLRRSPEQSNAPRGSLSLLPQRRLLLSGGPCRGMYYPDRAYLERSGYKVRFGRRENCFAGSQRAFCRKP